MADPKLMNVGIAKIERYKTFFFLQITWKLKNMCVLCPKVFKYLKYIFMDFCIEDLVFNDDDDDLKHTMQHLCIEMHNSYSQSFSMRVARLSSMKKH